MLTLLRPKHWIKNVFVLAPLVFAGQFLNHEALWNSGLAFVLFCLTSSMVYVLNDLVDVERDRRHPTKSKLRPIASGLVSKRSALILLALLGLPVLVGAVIVPRLGVVLLAYLLLNVAYAFWLKHQPVIDIFSIAAGFVLRVFAGAVVLAVPMSGWMFVTTLSLSLYLGAVKRRQELRSSGSDGRKVLEKYSVALVERYAEMSATGALVFYSMFVMSARPQLVMTVPLVMFGLFRYWFIVEQQEAGESPTEALLSDRILLATIVLWIGSCIWALWPASGI